MVRINQNSPAPHMTNTILVHNIVSKLQVESMYNVKSMFDSDNVDNS